MLQELKKTNGNAESEHFPFWSFTYYIDINVINK